MPKQSSYQKLKARNLELEIEIHTLITQPGTYAALRIKARKEMQYGMTDMLLFGSRDSDPKHTGGIYNLIKNQPPMTKLTLSTFTNWANSFFKRSHNTT